VIEEKYINVPVVTVWAGVWAKSVTRTFSMEGAVRAVTWNSCKAQ
jgi:hypothetical protein